jgi:outer membrane receptor protein involved in Fe transport
MRQVWTSLVTLALVAGVVPEAHGQVQLASRGPRFLSAKTVEGKRVDASGAAVLRQRVSLALSGASVETALREITKQADLELIFTRAVLPTDRTVTLHATDITVAGALTEVLLDTGLDVLLLPSGAMGIVPRTEPRTEIVQTGSIAGKVRDAKTQTALVGATVVIEGTARSATTGNDGRYRIANVPVGTYTLRTRYIGYAPASATVTVAPDQEATADFALEKSAQRLDEVVTTGALVPTEVKALPTPITVITADDIRRLHPARVSDVLQLEVPGLTAFKAFSGQLETEVMSVRGTSGLNGGAGSNPKLYIDGVDVTYSDRAPVDPESIERIEVIRGPQAAAVYGSDAMGGVIQIFTKRGSAGQHRPDLEARAALGVVESAFPGSGTTRQEYNASVRGGTTGASYDLGGGYTRTGAWIPYYSSSLPSAHAGLRVGQGPLVLDLSSRYYQQAYDDPLDPRLAAAAPGIFYPRFRHSQFRQETYAARVEYRPLTWWRHTVTLGIDRFTRNTVQQRPALAFPGDTLLFVANLEARRTSISYQTAVTSSLGGGVTADLTGGAEYYAYALSNLQTSGALTTDPLELAPGSHLNGTRGESHNTGLYAQAQLGFRDRLFLTGAVRAESNSEFGPDLGMPVSPRVGVAYLQQLGQATMKLRAAYGEAIRPPDLGQKDGNSFGQVANPALQPERQTGPDAGVDLSFGHRASLGVTYYHQSAKNLIQPVTLDALSDPILYQYQNLAQVRNTGWEFEGTLALGRVSVNGTFAITNSRPTDLGSFIGDQQVGEQIIGLPRHTGAFTVTATPVRNTSVTAALAYTGGYMNYDILALYRCFGGTGPCRNSDFANIDYLTTYPGFVLLSVSIEQQIARQLNAYVSVQDLSNRGSAASFDNSGAAPGRITMVGVRAHL